MAFPMLLIVFIITSSFSMSSCSSHAHLPEDTRLNSHGSHDNPLFRLTETRLVKHRAYYTVDDYGAKAGKGDNTRAFRRAWKVACASKNGVLVVPKHKVYHVQPITFEGPCRSTTTVKVYGTIRASVTRSSYKKDTRHWVMFKNVDKLRVQGGGIINGNGQVWWTKSCKIDKRQPCHEAPTAVTFYQCNNLRVSDLTIRNAQQMHLTFQKCRNVEAVHLKVLSPGKSPNTDGIHITRTQNITIKRCVIRTGDDCISIVSGSRNIRATDITCGPGHGISIGSLGAGKAKAHVSDVYVNRVKLLGSTNGVRIKTWQGGSGYVKNVVFQNIVMKNVDNPIIIDQHYCDQNKPCRDQGSAVQISNIQYRNIRGTSASKVAVKLDCSKRFPCHKILMKDINLKLENKKHGRVQASCSNVRLEKRGKISPRCS